MMPPKLHSMILGNANQYLDFVQFQSRNWQTWHLYSDVQRDEEEVFFRQQCGASILVCLDNIKCCVSAATKRNMFWIGMYYLAYGW
jgi:hypothetical protein